MFGCTLVKRIYRWFIDSKDFSIIWENLTTPINGETSTERPTKPKPTRISLPGNYDYNQAKNTVTKTGEDGTLSEFKVRTLDEL